MIHVLICVSVAWFVLSAKDGKGVQALEAALWDCKLSLVAQACDGQLAMGFQWPGMYPSQLMGVFGVLNALIGLHLKWKHL